jgi:hypothetical protein
LGTTEAEYPETKTPVPNRKNRAREAPIISIILSGLTANRFGSGALKFGGGENVNPNFGSSSVLRVVEARGVSGSSVDALIEVILFANRREVTGRNTGGGVKLRIPAMVFRQIWGKGVYGSEEDR